jgi:hypothetical protein
MVLKEQQGDFEAAEFIRKLSPDMSGDPVSVTSFL